MTEQKKPGFIRQFLLTWFAIVVVAVAWMLITVVLLVEIIRLVWASLTGDFTRTVKWLKPGESGETTDEDVVQRIKSYWRA